MMARFVRVRHVAEFRVLPELARGRTLFSVVIVTRVIKLVGQPSKLDETFLGHGDSVDARRLAALR